MPKAEVWMRGPLPGVPPQLMPVAHALVGAREELAEAAAPLTPGQLWARPRGAASVGFHLQHAAGSLDRLFTYARGEPLSAGQLETLRLEGAPAEPRPDASALLKELDAAIEGALEQLRGTDPGTLLEFRGVGRQQLPSTVLGLLFHAAEHLQRHVGQVITTLRFSGGEFVQ